MKIQRFNDYVLEEQMVEDFIVSFNGLINEESNLDNASQEIIDKFKQKFGDRIPSSQEFADFYHELRTSGIDGILIFNTLDPYMRETEDKYGDGSLIDSYK